MSKSVPASERTGQRIADLLAVGRDGDVKSTFIQLATRRVHATAVATVLGYFPRVV